jgi:uncharacterized protein
MREPLPDRVQLERLAQQQATLQGVWNSDRLQRILALPEVVAVGNIELTLSFTSHKTGSYLINGRIKAEMELICQRCLHSCMWPVDDVLRLAAGVEAEQVEGYEPVELDAGKLDIENLIEEELILRIPQVPVHAQPEDCNQSMVQRATEWNSEEISSERNGKNPFAVLKQLK